MTRLSLISDSLLLLLLPSAVGAIGTAVTVGDGIPSSIPHVIPGESNTASVNFRPLTGAGGAPLSVLLAPGPAIVSSIVSASVSVLPSGPAGDISSAASGAGSSIVASGTPLIVATTAVMQTTAASAATGAAGSIASRASEMASSAASAAQSAASGAAASSSSTAGAARESHLAMGAMVGMVGMAAFF